MLEFEPSTSTCTRAVRPARKSRVNPGGFAAPDGVGQLSDAAHFASDPKGLRIDELLDELPALGGAVLIQDQGRHVFHVGVQRVTESDHLHHRREQHKKERQRVTQNDQKFLVENGGEAAEQSVHGQFVILLFLVLVLVIGNSIRSFHRA